MDNTYSFDEIIDRRNTGSVKWDVYSNTDIIPLWVADMDFASSPAIVNALSERVSHRVFGYTWKKDSFIDSVVDWTAYRYGWDISPDWIVALPGVVCGMNVASACFSAVDEELITFTPIYHPFLEIGENVDRRLLKCPLKRDGGKFTFDLELFESTITDKIRVLLLSSPHNPVGRVWSKEELRAIGDICLKRNILICSDEIHCDLILEGYEHTPTAVISDEIAENTITLMAPSKTFNIPGLGCAFAIIPNKIIRNKFIKAIRGALPYMNLFAYDACDAAFNKSREWHKALIQYLSQNRDIVYDTINSIDGMWTDRVEATYLAWINIEGLGLDDPKKFFEDAGVGLSCGGEFGDGRFVRLNFGCPKQLLNEALNRIKKATRNI